MNEDIWARVRADMDTAVAEARLASRLNHTRCPSTHCERTQECRTPHDCSGTGRAMIEKHVKGLLALSNWMLANDIDMRCPEEVHSPEETAELLVQLFVHGSLDKPDPDFWKNVRSAYEGAGTTGHPGDWA